MVIGLWYTLISWFKLIQISLWYEETKADLFSSQFNNYQRTIDCLPSNKFTFALTMSVLMFQLDSTWQ